MSGGAMNYLYRAGEDGNLLDRLDEVRECAKALRREFSANKVADRLTSIADSMEAATNQFAECKEALRALEWAMSGDYSTAQANEIISEAERSL